ncbi:uncharacterized protein METZ01_LOCUS454424, partial [marine metagenome]
VNDASNSTSHRLVSLLGISHVFGSISVIVPGRSVGRPLIERISNVPVPSSGPRITTVNVEFSESSKSVAVALSTVGNPSPARTANCRRLGA